MNKKILIVSIILILAVAFILKNFPNVITGLLSQIVNLSIGIQNSTLARFVYFSYPSEVTLGNTATFSVNLQNIGNMNITAGIEIYVKNSLLTTVSSSYDVNYTLAPLDIRNFSASYTPTTIGTYWVIANATYNSTLETKTVEENRSFNVVSAPVIPPVPPVAPAAPISVPIIPVYNLTLAYSNYFNLTQNESFMILVYATNYGNVDLHSLTLSASIEKIELEVRPDSISVLPALLTTIFSISVKVPSDAEQGNYTLDFNVTSSEVKRTGRIIIAVYPVLVCPEVERAIRNYAILIDRISSEVERAASEGANVTLAREYLELARQSLEKAKELYSSNDCEGAKQALELVKKYLERIVIEITKLPPRPSYWLIFLILIIIFMLILIILFYRRKKEEEKKKKRAIRKSKPRLRSHSSRT